MFSLVGVARTRDAAEIVARSTALADAYARANKAIAEEESLERKYRLDRSDAVRARHALAGAALHGALADVEQRGAASDRALAVQLRDLHDEYGYALLQVFAAVDNRDARTAERISNDDVERIFEQLSGRIQRAADLHAARRRRRSCRCGGSRGWCSWGSSSRSPVGCCWSWRSPRWWCPTSGRCSSRRTATSTRPGTTR